MEENRDLYDMTIIGGGTAGLYAAYYAGMRDMKIKIIEYLPELGGMVNVFYPEKDIYDVGGIPKISGQDFIGQLIEQGLMFDPTVELGQAVEHLEKNPDETLKLTGDSSEIHHSKTVMIAAGPGLIKKKSQGPGYHFDAEPMKKWGFALENRQIPVNANMESNVKGVYVAGDMARYSKKWRLIASAFNEAITAINSAKAFIDPSAPPQVYSSILMDR